MYVTLTYQGVEYLFAQCLWCGKLVQIQGKKKPLGERSSGGYSSSSCRLSLSASSFCRASGSRSSVRSGSGEGNVSRT